MTKPMRGDVWLVDVGYAAEVRPALVLSVATDGDERVLTTVVLHTTSVRNTRFESASDVRWLKEGAFDAQGISTFSTVKLIKRLGVLPANQLTSVEKCDCEWLGLSTQLPDG